MKTATPKDKKEKKEKVFHPQSRKAGQLERKQLRVAKLGEAASKKSKKAYEKIDRHAFFFHALPPEVECLTLEQVHHIVRDILLPRHDEEIEREKKTRRKGRPPSAKEVKLEELKAQEAEEYRTGMEVIDLTHPANVTLLRRWNQDERAFLDLLRYIRISSTTPEVAPVTRPGRHGTLSGNTIDEVSPDAAETMAVD
ncbi:hypothetical protein SISSUDRAFT_1057887 [Sistotremastrum suecicum HHB10207 ss-3]|uniref:Translation machinery-associated protein 16 n=1 Tax=Sistotremastrum suecicum HHB10207 ss-3 TaxID=1314776 RepID=A0A166HVC9_9AGAM|nr:hypothetical protein SISSUDRAFT_1057887 [Sistotremastrum suecicum HHB10207 ss-3]